jgi:hypothetical protein
MLGTKTKFVVTLGDNFLGLCPQGGGCSLVGLCFFLISVCNGVLHLFPPKKKKKKKQTNPNPNPNLLTKHELNGGLTRGYQAVNPWFCSRWTKLGVIFRIQTEIQTRVSIYFEELDLEPVPILVPFLCGTKSRTPWTAQIVESARDWLCRLPNIVLFSQP